MHSRSAPGELRELVRGQSGAAYLLAWTTTPWTLPGNTALAVSASADYAVLVGEHDALIMASRLSRRLVPEGERSLARFPANNWSDCVTNLSSTRTTIGVPRMSMPEFEAQPRPEHLTYRVVEADFVSLEDGTGIVHMAPSFGEVDFEAGMREKLDFVQQVDLDGKVTGSYAFAGKFVKDADADVIE